MTLPDCLLNIVGITRQPCDCLADLPVSEDFPTSSDSDLWLSDLVDIEAALNATDCGELSAWNAASNALKRAKTDFMADANKHINMRYRPVAPKFSGTIGKGNGGTIKTYQHQWSGVRIHTRRMKNAYLKINKVGGIFSGSGELTLKIMTANGQVGDDIVFDVTANAHSVFELPQPIVLPLWQDYTDENTDYFIVYERPNFGGAKINALGCNCGGCYPTFRLDRPIWGQNTCRNETQLWQKWAIIGGVDLENLTYNKLYESSLLNPDMSGLTLNCEFYCDQQTAICPNGEFDFTEGYSLNVANAINYKAAVYLIEKIVSSGRINRYTQLSGEDMLNLATIYQSRYMEHLSAAFDKIELNCDCYQKAPSRTYVRSIV